MVTKPLSNGDEMNNAIYISEAGAYRALASMTVKAGLTVTEVKRSSKVFPVLKRGEMKGYGLVFCGRVVKEN